MWRSRTIRTKKKPLDLAPGSLLVTRWKKVLWGCLGRSQKVADQWVTENRSSDSRSTIPSRNSGRGRKSLEHAQRKTFNGRELNRLICTGETDCKWDLIERASNRGASMPRMLRPELKGHMLHFFPPCSIPSLQPYNMRLDHSSNIFCN